MLQYFKQNKSVIMVAISMFIVSLSVLILFLGEDMVENSELTVNVVDSISLKSEQQAEEHYRSLIVNQDNPFLVINLDGTIKFAGWNFAAETGFTTEDMKEKIYYDCIKPEDLSVIMAAIGTVIEREEPQTMVGPFRFTNADGEQRYHIASLYPYLEEGKITSIIVSFKDITDDIEGAKASADQEDVSNSPNTDYPEVEDKSLISANPDWNEGESGPLLAEN